jgi:hypothetical protein
VAVGCHSDFDQYVCWLEVGGDVDFVDLVGLVELHHLDGFHFLGEFFDAHFGCSWDRRIAGLVWE